jgi:CheY-like chemotaxis protein
VDDDLFVREILTLRLARERFEVQQAEDGIDALAKLRQKLPQVIVSDLVMPRMSGIEFISVVRRRFPFIPVIAFSGSIPGDFPAEAKPDAWFEKGPQQFHALLQAVRDFARKTPDRPYLPQVISIPARTRPNGAGYFALTCTDCLRVFQVASAPDDKTVERIAVCTHCEARVPFLIESSQAA